MPLWGIKFKPADDGGVASRGGRQTAGSGPHPTPSPADGRGPALESHLGTEEPQRRSVSAERPWRSLGCNMSPPRLPPRVESLPPYPGRFPRLKDSWLPDTQRRVPNGCCHPQRSLGGACLMNTALWLK